MRRLCRRRANGNIKVFAYNSTDLIMDINGYFAAPGQGGYSFYPAAPCRAYDSRNNDGQPFQGERTVNIVNSPCVPPEQCDRRTSSTRRWCRRTGRWDI